MTPSTTAPYTLWQLVRYMLRLGSLGFGGPVALTNFMRRDLVDERRWISESDYKEGLALAQLLPGPLAFKLAIYLGYVHHGAAGATLIGIAFVVPSFLMVLGLGWVYTRYGAVGWMEAVFYGVGAAVIGIIAISAYRLTTKSIGRDRLLWAIFIVLAVTTVVTESESPWLFLAAGAIVWLTRAPPRWLKRGDVPVMLAAQLPAASTVAASIDWPLVARLGLFFTEASAFVFGSGLAIVPFLYGGVVTENHWLDDRQFVDAVAVAMVTPGPVVITTGFIGYLVAGATGAVVAALGTFLPPFLLTVIAAPYFRKYGKLPGLVAFVDGVTAAAIGAITGGAVVIARHSIADAASVGIAVVTVLLLWRFRKLQEPVIVAGAALAGLAIHALLGG
jgi:chromate transporter